MENHPECEPAGGFCEACPLAGTTACPNNFDEAWEDLGIGSRYHAASFEGIANPEHRRTLEVYCADLPANVVAGRTLIFSGGTGTGKTCMLALVARAALKAGLRVAFFYVPALFDALHKDNQDVLKRVRAADLLLLDDFGVQYATDWTLSRFDALVEYRNSRLGKATCLSTNLTMATLKKMPEWQRVVDRWLDTCTLLATGKKSMRGSREAGE